MRPLRRVLHALGALGLLLAGSLVGVAVLAPSACACNKRMAYRAAMKADLRNLAAAQEARQAATGEFAGELADFGSDEAAFTPSQGVLIVIEHADSLRWRGRATHYRLGPTDSCTIDGSVTTSRAEADFKAVHCDPDSSGMRRAGGLNVMCLKGLLLDVALVLMLGARNQMRLALESS